ncbi:two-component system sensor protein [Pseudonocardia sp. Ae168_Ps1]|uniref:sensor histidine kinase n=1 Tax=unclassified Pseudonocardia TaxID=2619320 RepID=UPI00095ECE13|nr:MULTISPECIES: histidine kinase [unclassified Pseudonocardia]OLL73530.1 two-component system sensor protein [Pseudonocardia sp. Ae150A_Ps1]OLL79501.1 two-component system sensor protein [Pseudonocardia sp. Ae168_Ps1]OLL86359.1 two-component system sensor protein [Pseudonocardia sp. Ae263_Ps1]OLL93597.1 two-component system sensor protein [Pseudonocardia sp. Ae356_Ps1]
MDDRPLPAAHKFETFVRWSTYSAVALPVATFLGSALVVRGPIAAEPLLQAGVLTVALVLAAGNVVVARWSIDTVTAARRRPARRELAVAVGWLTTLAVFVVVTPLAPLPGIQLTVVAGIASAAASVVPALGVGRTVLLNAAVVVVTILVVGFADIPALIAGLVVLSWALWACWSNAWMLRVLRELQAAHADRAALALAEQRLGISRDLHDVLGRTLATIAVKSALAGELLARERAERAGQELAAIRGIAEEAGTTVRRVVRGEHHTSWDDEIAGARSLLASAGIACTVAGVPVPPECTRAFGLVVREAVTNLLRHSQATQVTISTTRGDGTLQLTVTNDGVTARRTDGTGSGLTALSDRLGALGGRLGSRVDGGWFVVDATVPAPERRPVAHTSPASNADRAASEEESA